MSENDELLKVVRGWVDKADEDLQTAVLSLRAGNKAPVGTVCFHAQQCIEKCVKAYLTWRNVAFPRTHDIADLVVLMPPRSRPVLPDAEQDRLTEYATVTRYPGNYEPVSLAEARRAVAMARRIRNYIGKMLLSFTSQT